MPTKGPDASSAASSVTTSAHKSGKDKSLMTATMTDEEDDFEEQMEGFWKNDKKKIARKEDIDSYLEDDDPEDFGEDAEIHGLNEIQKKEVNRLIQKEQDDLLSGVSDGELKKELEELPKGKEKIILDRLNVESLINMISKIRLAWPENLPGFDPVEFSTDPGRVKYKESFYRNTDKEKVVLWHAENFRKQFHEKFQNRRPLIIAPPNECGCQKLLPTYIHPGIVGYPEMLTAKTQAEFLKEYLKPELMDPPSKAPSKIRSHFTVLRSRNANAYEFALCLVSFLIGIGYDAYVIDGYASKALTNIEALEGYFEDDEVPEDETEAIMYRHRQREKILSNEEFTKAAVAADNLSSATTVGFEFMNDWILEDRNADAAKPISPSKYRFKSKMAANIAASMAAAEHHDEHGESRDEQHDGKHDTKEVEVLHEAPHEGEEGNKEQMKPEQKPSDIEEALSEATKDPCAEKYFGIRTHAWVLVKATHGRREVEKSYFIEPFSGKELPLDDENFLGVETAFNHQNFYVSLPHPQKTFAKDLTFDFDDKTQWAKFLDEPEKKKKAAPDGDDMLFQDDEEEAPKKFEFWLDMPSSWTPSPFITQEDYDRKFPGGRKMVNYHDAIMEQVSPYASDDGLVKKLLKFDNESRNPDDLLFIEERFEHRKDKMIRRRWDREGRMVHEYFAKGRKDALKEHVHIAGKNKPSYPRDIYYYANAHTQGVAHRQIVPKGMIEYFEGRDDGLYYRFTSYGPIMCISLPKKPSETELENPSKSKAKKFLEMLKGNEAGGKKRVRRQINIIIEKYHRNPSKDVKDDIAEKQMLLGEGSIRVMFHYGEGNQTRHTLEFFKTKGPNLNDTEEFHPESCIEYRPDPNAPQTDLYSRFKLLQRLEAEQRVSAVLAAQAEEEVFETVTGRIQEDFRHDVVPDPYSGEKFEEYMKAKEKAEGVHDEEEQQEDLTGIDLLTSPFFDKYGTPRNKMEEILAKRRIMLHAKVRLLKQAHAMRLAFERDAAQLLAKVKWFQRQVDKMSPGQEEEFKQLFRECLFRLNVREKRILDHQEAAPRKYYNLLQQVMQHVVLNKYSNRKPPPPPPPGPEDLMSPEEKARLAALKKDCCQFYIFRYDETKANAKGKRKQNEEGHENPGNLENPEPSVIINEAD